MVKRKDFEKFINAYRNTDRIDLKWNNDFENYESLKTQELYQFYSDIFEHDIAYRLAMIKTFVLCVVSLGVLLFTVISSVNIHDFFITILKPPINELISVLISLAFLSIFIIAFIMFFKKEFAE